MSKAIWRWYLETDPGPIAMVIRVKLLTHKPSQTNTNWQCMVIHAWLSYLCLLSAGLVDEYLTLITMMAIGSQLVSRYCPLQEEFHGAQECLQMCHTGLDRYNKLLGTRGICLLQKSLLYHSYKNNTIQRKCEIRDHQMKSFIAKRVISILVNLRYLRFKLLKYKENNKKICNTFDHNVKNIPLYIMSNVSLERYYFVLYDGALTSKMSKMALNAFCNKTLQIVIVRICYQC